ncbi:MAG: hypothetical protein R3D30_11510 [Hyphomicrobiales bacterium]
MRFEQDVTYCVGILLDEGVVLASDSRTNAGIDRVSTFRKMFTFEKPGERFFTLLTAGNLSLTQGVISMIGEWINSEDPERDLFAVGSMFGAARILGNALREVHQADAGYLQQRDVDFTASFILAGQVKGGQLRLFLIYMMPVISSRRWAIPPISRLARSSMASPFSTASSSANKSGRRSSKAIHSTPPCALERFAGGRRRRQIYRRDTLEARLSRQARRRRSLPSGDSRGLGRGDL